MNTVNLKSYAPQARKDFIAAVTARANLLGLSEAKGALQITEAEVKNDIVMIAGRPWPVKVNEQRTKLIARMKLQGFGHTVEAVAYAWFNRLAALRYMEVHDYLGHGRRVLSNPQGGLPEVLAHALDLLESNALPGLSADTVRELKLANQDPELYRLILIAQCNALHQAMPFLFEQLGDETELLLPENLLLTDSVVAKLVQSIPEADWQQIEIIGWLYQFYISEKKDQVIGKVVKSEDIPAATQLFTPNWIVKYMVQNSLGAQWLATYPGSPLKAQMAYYIEPAEQTDEVNAQLAAITPASLNPEELTLIDPASGSGHILVEAYDLFKAIYLERGYRQRDVAKLILEKNLFGLDIDERAAQLTSFALMMKARADDRQLFERGVKLNVMALVDSTGFDAVLLAQAANLADHGLTTDDLMGLKKLFDNATTFGSLIRVPAGQVAKLSALKRLSETTSHDIFMANELERLRPLVRQAELLVAQYDAVVANPPYMGRKYLNPLLKRFASTHYESGQADLYAMFIERTIALCKGGHHVAMICMDSWLSGEDFQGTRQKFAEQGTFVSMCHLGPHAFPEITGEVVQVASFVASVGTTSSYECTFVDLVDEKSSGAKEQKLMSGDGRSIVAISAFADVPRGVFTAYRASPPVLAVFADSVPLKEIAEAFTGLQTGDNPRFIRYWFELPFHSIAFGHGDHDAAYTSGKRWFPYVKGSDYRKWYGNQLCVVDWEDAGKEIRSHPSATVRNADHYFRPGIAYNNIAKRFSARSVDSGFIFDQKNSMFFADSPKNLPLTLGLLHSDAIGPFLRILSPKDFGPGALKIMPVPKALLLRREVDDSVTRLVKSHRKDWDSFEESWDFESIPMLTTSFEPARTLESSYTAWITQNRDTIAEMKRLEEENNRLFIEAYGLHDELTPDVSIEQITLTVNPAYRYGGKLMDEQLWTRFRENTMQELVSYAIGCMMGRYSLDGPGLIYANSGNVGFDASRYTKFPADVDGIVPVTEELWFEDDAALRVRELLLAVWDKDSLDQNMAFLAENLGLKASESPEQTIRRYLADKFFKDHLQTYKKRPIYWLFSSGKQGAFQALVYLHRYNAGTLSRLRAEYVVPLTGKMQTKIEELEQDVAASSSTAQRNKLTKQLEKLRKQHLELLAYDEQLRHYADQRITLDLDDGVKVNYGKFGDLLADVKAVTGGKSDDE